MAKSTVEQDRVRPRKPSSPPWQAFRKIQLPELVAVDFFPVPPVGFKVLFVLIGPAHERRNVVHFNLTAHQTAQWTARPLVNTFLGDAAPNTCFGTAMRCMAIGVKTNGRTDVGTIPTWEESERGERLYAVRVR